MVRFVHTADLQIGKPFNWASERAQAKLKEAREEAIGRIGQVASDHEADFVLIAGDFFDENTVSDDVVARTCQRLSNIEIPVYILPGNHDFSGTPSSVYRRPLFKDQNPDHVHVLTEKDPVLVGDEESEEADAAILPAPVEHRNERGDPTAHIGPDLGPSGTIRIGLAHGGVEDFGAGEATSRIDPVRSEEAELNYLALGDWHGTTQVGERTWYSGTPEPDSFKQNDPGNVLVVTVDSPAAKPDVQRVATESLKWFRKEATLQGAEDLASLERWFESIENPLQAVVQLELNGGLYLEAVSELEALKERVENIVLDVRHRGSVRPSASKEELQQIGSGGYVSDTVETLQGLSEGGGEDAEIADRALQLLYQFHRGQEAA